MDIHYHFKKRDLQTDFFVGKPRKSVGNYDYKRINSVGKKHVGKKYRQKCSLINFTNKWLSSENLRRPVHEN